ncbi:hypothetical protein Pint_03761 [Pistacia integerrima]|uniref:Uncharacterized protein n=1 Tax=Pistacia integerrima TaxID=434235 RepID=A0ACC0Z6H7_9ROSI|nr:hypothetical protein Pint_03761 [Pistacia integerrima]
MMKPSGLRLYCSFFSSDLEGITHARKLHSNFMGDVATGTIVVLDQTARHLLAVLQVLMTSLVAGKNHLKQVRDLAYEIEDAIKEFMLEVPDHSHEHKISQFLHDVAHSVNDKKPVARFSCMETIKAKIKDIKFLDAFRILPLNMP